jgi:hypothetical protein
VFLPDRDPGSFVSGDHAMTAVQIVLGEPVLFGDKLAHPKTDQPCIIHPQEIIVRHSCLRVRRFPGSVEAGWPIMLAAPAYRSGGRRWSFDRLSGARPSQRPHCDGASDNGEAFFLGDWSCPELVEGSSKDLLNGFLNG